MTQFTQHVKYIKCNYVLYECFVITSNAVLK